MNRGQGKHLTGMGTVEMLIESIAIILMLAVLDRSLWGGRKELALLEAEYRIFALRDELRRAVLAGTIGRDRWFEYMDTSLTLMVRRLGCVNLWEAFAIYWAHKDDEKVESAWKEFQSTLETNPVLAEIKKEYSDLLFSLLVARHPVIVFAVRTLAYFLTGVARFTTFFRDSFPKTFLSAPETSTLLRYCE